MPPSSGYSLQTIFRHGDVAVTSSWFGRKTQFSDGPDRGAQEEMNMKRILVGTLALGLLAMPALADRTVTPMNGTMGNPFNNGLVHGFGWNAAAGGGGPGGLGNLYDNILTINGGAATAGFYGPFADIPGTQAFIDWVGSPAQWSDDLHGISAGTGLPAVVTKIYYGYSNGVGFYTRPR